ncbi:MAG: response regulator [Cyanobacteria bacterium P01_A01_bin.135]
MRILLVDDDEALMETLAQALIKQRYAVDIAADGATAQEFLDLFAYDLIVLDMLLPDIEGTALCQQLRRQGLDCPILMLTAQDASPDKVRALDAGADDYVIKPFDFQELCARMRALLRRNSQTATATLHWGAVSLSPDTFEVFYRAQQLHLTPKEYALLELLLRHPDRVYSLDAIIENLWSFEDPPSEDAVRTHVKGLRQKLKAGGAPKDLIETVYGVGYRLKPLDDESGDESDDDSAPPESLEQMPTRSDIATALATAWNQSSGEMHQRLSALDAAAAAIAEGAISPELRRAGHTQAHKLAGSLGCFGLPEGSRLARELEQLLQSEAPLTAAHCARFTQAVAQLRSLIEQKPGPSSTAFEETSGPAVDWLWLVGAPEAIAQDITAAAQAVELQSTRLPHCSSARERLQHQIPGAIALWLDETNFGEALLLLSALRRACSRTSPWQPPIPTEPELSRATVETLPALVLTEIQDFQQRLQLVQQGTARILSTVASPQAVVEAVQQVRRTVRPNASILVVDDDDHVLKLLQMALIAWGLQVTTLNAPEQLFQVLEAVHPDLLVLDIEMPGANGLEICQVLRADERWWQLPILFLTVHGETEVEQQAYSVGADDFVHKATMVQELPVRILNRLK